MSTSFRDILVPLDGSEVAQQALAVGASIARRTGGRLHLVTVQEPIPVAVTAEVGQYGVELERESRQQLTRYLTDTQEATRGTAGIPVEGELLDGMAADAIAEYADGHEIGLLVMTTHARKGLARWWLGSVADRLLRRTTIPVLLLPPRARPQPTEFHRILVALAGEADDAVLRPALALAALGSGVALRLIRVVPPAVPIMSPLPAYPRHGHPDWAKREEIAARATLARHAARLQGSGARAATEVIASENVAEALLDAAGTMAADLIVVGTHGAGGVERLILGSVADKVIRGAGRPVLVVPVGAG